MPRDPLRAQRYKAIVTGTGSYLPEAIISNKDLEAMVDTSNEWIVERTGIKNRHKAAPEQNTTDLAYIAATRALEDANISPEDLDAIVFATVASDQMLPTGSCILQRKLGAKNCMAVDLAAACTGFVYGVSMANDFIAAGSYKNVLVIGAEILTRLVNYEDRDTCILFGDGAGAFVVSRANDESESYIYSHHLHADGYISDLFELPMGGTAYRYSHENLDRNLHYMRMKGREVFKHAVRTMSLCCAEALEFNSMTGQDVQWLIPHQANTRIIEAVAKHFGISMEKVILDLENMGNTSAATIPVVFDRARRSNKIKRGDTCLLTAFGAGITSGSLLMRF